MTWTCKFISLRQHSNSSTSLMVYAIRYIAHNLPRDGTSDTDIANQERRKRCTLDMIQVERLGYGLESHLDE